MSIDRFKEVIVDSIKEMPQLEAYDLTEGTNAYDLIILPMAEILYNELGTEILDSYINRYDMSNVEDMEISDLIRVGALHAVQYREEAQTTGFVVLCFLNNAVNFSIRAGSTLTYQDVEFIIQDELHITSAMLTGPGVDGLYRTHPIYVYNEAGQSIAANMLGQLDGAPTTLVMIEHSAMTNGVPALDKEIFRQQIVNSLHTRQLVGYASISNLVRDLAPSVRRIKIVGAGDPDMTRDTILDINNLMGYKERESGFAGKLSGVITSNTNQAFKMFTNIPIDGETPGPAALLLQNATEELSDLEYSRIADETNTILISSDMILSEEFDIAPAEQEVNLEDITANDTVLTLAPEEDLPGNMVANRLLLINGIEHGTETPIWYYVLIRSVDAEAGTITLYRPIPSSIDEPTATLDTRDGYAMAEGWYKAEHGVVISPELGYDFSVSPQSSSIVYFTSEEVGVLGLGTAKPIFSELQAMVHLLQEGGEVNLLAAMVKGMYPVGFDVVYPRRGQRVSISGQLHVRDVHLIAEFSHDAIYNEIIVYTIQAIDFMAGTYISLTGTIDPPPNPFTDALNDGLLIGKQLRGSIFGPISDSPTIQHIQSRTPSGYRLQLSHYPEVDDIRDVQDTFFYPDSPHIARVRRTCRIVVAEEMVYPTPQTIKTQLMWRQTYSSHYEIEVRETTPDGSPNWDVPAEDFDGRVWAQKDITNPYTEIQGLTVGKRYYWRVRAISKGGSTEWLYSHFRMEMEGVPPSFEVGIIDDTQPPATV